MHKSTLPPASALGADRKISRDLIEREIDTLRAFRWLWRVGGTFGFLVMLAMLLPNNSWAIWILFAPFVLASEIAWDVLIARARQTRLGADGVSLGRIVFENVAIWTALALSMVAAQRLTTNHTVVVMVGLFVFTLLGGFDEAGTRLRRRAPAD